jgi:hypothetical protein
MTTTSTAVRLLATILIIVLGVTLATPSRAEAVEALAVVAIIGAVVVVTILVVYLVVANTRSSRTAAADDAAPVMVEVVVLPAPPQS